MSGPARLLPMTAAHLPEALAIERASTDYPWSEANFRDSLVAGYAAWVLVDEAARVQGFALLGMGAGEAQVLNLGVDPALRRQGLGRRLLAHLLMLACAAGMEQAILEVRRSNASAIALYRALGFATVGERRGYYRRAGGGEDALVMTLELPRPPA